MDGHMGVTRALGVHSPTVALTRALGRNALLLVPRHLQGIGIASACQLESSQSSLT